MNASIENRARHVLGREVMLKSALLPKVVSSRFKPATLRNTHPIKEIQEKY
jgi:hypothetical protein